MLRLLIGTGVLLMAVGFGAAGWQYWQGLPASPDEGQATAAVVATNPAATTWLITPTGGIVPQGDARAYLEQQVLVPERLARLTVTAALDALLVEGEKLPAAPYLEVLADIRAPQVAQRLCPVLADGVAQTCTVHAARVRPGSVDAQRGEARFEIELAFRQNVEGAALPDLAAHVLRTETVMPDPAIQPPPASVEAALAEVVQAVRVACSAEDRMATCRLLGIELAWSPGAPRQASARIAWLAPLPEGMVSLPPLSPAPGG